MEDEGALTGWSEICQYLRRNLSEKKKHKLKNSGIIFYRLKGIPPHRQRFAYTFPSLLHKFLSQNKDF